MKFTTKSFIILANNLKGIKHMAGLNQASLIGRIGNFLELKGKEGKEVVNFSVATENAMDKKADPE